MNKHLPAAALVALPLLLGACSSSDASSAPVVKGSPKASVATASPGAQPATGSTEAPSVSGALSGEDAAAVRTVVVGFNDRFFSGDLQGACARVVTVADREGGTGYVRAPEDPSRVAACVAVLASYWQAMSSTELSTFKNTAVAHVGSTSATQAVVSGADVTVTTGGPSYPFALGLTKDASGWRIAALNVIGAGS